MQGHRGKPTLLILLAVAGRQNREEFLTMISGKESVGFIYYISLVVFPSDVYL